MKINTDRIGKLFDNAPPHSPESETELLGSMILDPSVIPSVLEVLPDAGAFYQDDLGLVFRAVVDLWDEYNAVDSVLLTNKLREWGVLERVDVAGIAGSVAVATNAEHHAREVVRKHAQRRRIRAAASIIEGEFRAQNRTDDEERKAAKAAVEAMVGATETPAAGGFAPVNIADLVRLYPDMREPLIHGLLRRTETMNVVAPPKARKSWLVHALVIAAATGSDFFGMAVKKCRVLLIDAELHRETLSSRLAWTCKQLGYDPCDLEKFVDIWPVRGKGWDIHSVAAEFRHRRIPKDYYGLVVLDALYRFMPKGGEENSNDTMTTIYNAMDALGERTGAGITLVHHSTKGSQAEKEVHAVGAGGGAQSRAADTHLIFRNHEEPGAVIVEANLRTWKPLEPFVLRWTDAGWQRDDSMDPTALKGGKRSGGRAGDREAKRSYTSREFVDEILGDETLSREALLLRAKKMGGIGRDATLKLVVAAKELGLLRESQADAKSHKFYTRIEGEAA